MNLRKHREQEVMRLLGRLPNGDLERLRLFNPPMTLEQIRWVLPEMPGRALQDLHAKIIGRSLRLAHERAQSARIRALRIT